MSRLSNGFQPRSPTVPAGAPAQLPALTAIRGIAAWWIVLFHFREVFPSVAPGWIARLAEGGYLAVDLFFVLSGFVIALNYAETLLEQGPRAIPRFLAFRLARIYPLHAAVLLMMTVNPVVILLLSSQADPGARYDVGYLALSVLLIQNWGFTSVLAWNVPAWSISTEWFVYLVFPAVVLASSRLAGGPVRSAALGLAVAAAIALAAGQVPGGLGGDIPSFGLFRCVSEFTLGVCVFWAWRRRSRVVGLQHAAAFILAAAGFAAYLLALLPDYVAMPASFALLIYALSESSALPARLLDNPVLIFAGEVSYSTYLIHYLVRDWVKFLLVRPGVSDAIPIVVYISATALLSVALHRLIEVPGRGWMRHRFEVAALRVRWATSS